MLSVGLAGTIRRGELGQDDDGVKDQMIRKTIMIRTKITPSPQADYPNLFPDFTSSLAAQKMLAGERRQVIPARHYREILVRAGWAGSTGNTGH